MKVLMKIHRLSNHKNRQKALILISHFGCPNDITIRELLNKNSISDTRYACFVEQALCQNSKDARQTRKTIPISKCDTNGMDSPGDKKILDYFMVLRILWFFMILKPKTGLSITTQLTNMIIGDTYTKIPKKELKRDTVFSTKYRKHIIKFHIPNNDGRNKSYKNYDMAITYYTRTVLNIY